MLQVQPTSLAPTHVYRLHEKKYVSPSNFKKVNEEFLKILCKTENAL